MEKLISALTVGLCSMLIGIAVGWFVREKVIEHKNKAKNVATV